MTTACLLRVSLFFGVGTIDAAPMHYGKLNQPPET